MKGKMRFIYPLTAVLFLVIAIVAASAAGQPGSSSDPLVTKSYVDQQIALLSARIGNTTGTSGTGTIDNTAVAQLKTDVGDLTQFVIDALTELNNVKNRITSIENGFVVLELKKGQKLMMGSGSEVILRSGQATAIKGESGTLVDVSAGVDLLQGNNIPLQHLVVSPKSDGRGMEFKANTNYVIVRGSYSIK